MSEHRIRVYAYIYPGLILFFACKYTQVCITFGGNVYQMQDTIVKNQQWLSALYTVTSEIQFRTVVHD